MNIRDDKHLGPWALYELGLMNMESGDYGEAEKYFKSAKWVTGFVLNSFSHCDLGWRLKQFFVAETIIESIR